MTRIALTSKKPSGILVTLFLFLLCFVMYASTMHAEFVLDAHYAIAKNPTIKQPALYMRILKGDLIPTHKEWSSHELQYYRPVPLASFAVDYRLWRLNTVGYHFTNMMIHFLNAVLVYILVLNIFQGEKLALLSSVIFSVLPTQEWVVNYIVTRADLLQALFMFSSLILFVNFLKVKRLSLIFLSLLCFILALLSRELSLIFPLFIFLIGYILLKDKIKTSFYMLPYVAISAVYFILRLFLKPLFPRESGLEVLGSSFSIAAVGDWCIITIAYFSRFILPWAMQDLIFPALKLNFLVKLFILTCFLLIGLIYTLREYKKSKKIYFIFGWIWILINFLPFFLMIPQFTKIGPVVSEHYLYFASLGFCLILGGLILNTRDKIQKVLIVAVIAYYCSLVAYYNFYWTKEETLLRWVNSMEGKNRHISGDQLLMLYQSQDTQILRKIEEAKTPAQKSRWLIVLGANYMKNQEYKKAIHHYREALSIFPDSSRANLALGRAFMENKQTKLAVEHLEKALKLDPESEKAYHYLGIINYRGGQLDEAVSYFKQARFYNPDNVDNLLYLSASYIIARQNKLAIPILEEAVDLEKEDSFVYRFIAAELYKYGQPLNSINFLNRANELFPKDTEVLVLLAKIYFNLGKKDRAVTLWQETLRIDPNHKEAKMCLSKTGDKTGIVDIK